MEQVPAIRVMPLISIVGHPQNTLMTYRVILVKLLPERYETDFLEGNLYLNTAAYFASVDRTDAVRSDPHEGIVETHHVSKFEIQDPEGEWHPLPVIGPISVRDEASTRLNVLCMFTVTDKPDDVFDARNLDFGERAVVIDNLVEFIARVKRAAEASGRKVDHAPIEYVDRATYSGRMGPFRKFSTHSYQNEFRFVFLNGTGQPGILSIGSIRDVAHSIPAIQLPAFWETMRNAVRSDG